MEEKIIAEIRKEIRLLESWIKDTKGGGWSTQLVKPMETRVSELKGLLWDAWSKVWDSND